MSGTCSCDSTVQIFRKRDRAIRVTVTGPGDLTGAKIWFSVKADLDDADGNALIVKKSANNNGSDEQAKVTDGPGGILEIYILSEDTENINEGDYWFDVVLEVDTRKIEAVKPSRFRVVQPVTMT